MNPVLDMIMNAAGGGSVQQLGRQFGLSEEQTQGALAQLVPAVMTGLQNNTAQEGGIGALVGALTRGNHSRYIENPELLAEESTTADGNAILGHVFGSKDVSRAVAGQAAEQTGIGADVLKKMLPLVATMVMGGLSTQNATAAGASGESGLGSVLTSCFDQNRSGGITDEVTGLLGRFLSGR
jgi:hypothetical protein